MNLSAKITAVISSLTLVFSVAAPCSSYAVQVSPPDVISSESVAASPEDAALQMREYLKSHTTEFSIETNKNGYNKDEIAPIMMYKAFEETGSGTEGDYLRFAVRSYKCRITSYTNYYKLTYNITYFTTPEEEDALTRKINEIISSLNIDKMSDYQKIEALYRYVTTNVEYSEDMDDPHIYSAYNAVFNGNAVCQGVAQLMYRMYTDCGISCRVIAGTSVDLDDPDSDGNHVWLIVKLDGIYYLLDPTWDLGNRFENCLFFLKGSSDFDSNNSNLIHVANNNNKLTFPDYNSDEFKAAYPISKTKYVKKNYSLGDINGDKLIDSVDASLILAEYTKLSSNMTSGFTSEQSDAADINIDGKIDSIDASQILAYYATVSSGNNISLTDFINVH
jgi:hypothetical protein